MATENVTTKFRVDISDLKKNISEANRQVKLYRAELKNASAGMKNGADDADSLTKKIEAQEKIVEAEKQKLQALKEELKRYEERIASGKSVVDDLTEKHKKAAEAFGEDSEQAKKLAEQLRKAQEAQERNENAADKLRLSIVNQDTAVKNAEGNARDFTAQLGQLQQAEGKVRDTTATVGDAFEKTTNGGLKAFTVALGNLIADTVKKAISGLGNLAQSVLDVGISFDTSMSKVKAISGASADEMEQLTAKAEELGTTTKFTATQAANAMGYMAMAGWKTEDMLNGIDGVMNLAAASGAELATTSDIVTDALTAFGESAGEAGRLADIMAAASSNSNTNVEMMGETFKYAASLAGALGYSMEDTAVSIGLMANAGIKSTQAGTSLRSLFTRLSKQPKEAASAMAALGISMDDGHGKMKSWMELMQDLRGSFGHIQIPLEEFQRSMGELDDELESGEIDEEEYEEAQGKLIKRAYGAEGALKAQYAAMLASTNGLSGFLALVNASDADFNKLTKSVYQSEGAAKEMAGAMKDNLGGDLTILDSALDGFKKKLYDNVKEPLRDIAQIVTEKVVPELNNMADAFARWLRDFQEEHGSISENVERFIDSAIPAIKEFLQWIYDHGGEIQSTLVGIVTAIAAFKTVTAIQSAITAFQALAAMIELVGAKQLILNTIMAANPVGLIITAVAGLIAYLVTLYHTSDEFREKVDMWGESLLETFEMYGNGIKNFWENLKEGFQLFSDAMADFWDDFKVGWKAIGDWLKNGINAFLGWFEGKINFIPSIINTAIRAMNKLTGSDYPEIPEVSIPKLARGGIVDRATLAQIGEAGREAVIPLEHNKAGLREIAGLLAGEMRGSSGAGQAAAGTGTVVNINQTNTSPKALSTYEIWRNNKKLAELLKTVR